MSTPIVVLASVPAVAGVGGYLLTRLRGAGVAWLFWGAILSAAFVVLQSWYGRSSGCEAPATYYVPAVGAFAAASGVWVGITRARDRDAGYSLVRIAVESIALSLVPGVFFVLLLWPCR
jgi:hypothetical protein